MNRWRYGDGFINVVKNYSGDLQNENTGFAPIRDSVGTIHEKMKWRSSFSRGSWPANRGKVLSSESA